MVLKRRLLTIIGVFFLFSGVLLLIAILSAWLITPPIPSDEAFLAGAQTNQVGIEWGSGPALSTFEPTADVGFLPDQTPTETADDPQQLNGFSSAQDDPNVLILPPSDMGNDIPVPTSKEKSEEMRMIIPEIGVDAPVLSVQFESIIEGGRQGHAQWQVPDSYAAGWHNTSAPLGQPGNSVINGHNNIHGSIFHNLVDLPLGGKIMIESGDQILEYQVTGREFLLEQGEPLRNRLFNARWISPTDDERLTIVTCWPNSSNSHRLVVIAHPVDRT